MGLIRKGSSINSSQTIDEQSISTGGVLTIPSDLSSYEYLRFEVNNAGASNASVSETIKSSFIQSCRVALHHDDATGYIYFDTNASGTIATLANTGAFSGVVTARVVGIR